MNTVTEGGVLLADYDWDTLSRRDLVKLNANGFNMDLAYEADDDLLTLAHTGPAPLTFTFGRNNSGQITGLTASDGNFLSRPNATQAVAYVPNRLNQYASVGGTAYSHDANGNLTSDGTYTYEYDEENRLRSAVGGGFTTSYEYDPLGRRRAKVVNGTTTKFVSDNAEEIEERDGANAVFRRYVYGSGIDERIAMLDTACTGGRCYYLTNWQGSTTTLINQTGSTLNATYHYGPYGEGTNWTPADALTGNPFRYTGRRVDPETGLYYYRARYYSPKLGRFLQTDPIGTKDDLNLFTYSLNDSINKIDPAGLYACQGTKRECAQIRTFVKTLNSAARNLPSGSDAQKAVQEIAAYVGTEGDNNGVTLVSAVIEGTTSGEARANNTIALDLGKLNTYAADAGFSKTNPGKSQDEVVAAVGAGTIAHEGEHQEGFRTAGKPKSRAAEYALEVEAYTTESAVHRGLDINSGLWHSDVPKGVIDAAIKNAAERSTDEWCRKRGGC